MSETVKVNMRSLGKKSKTPILSYCRKLIKEGFPEDSKLEVYREREEPDVIVNNIGEAAKLSVSGTRFVPYKKFPGSCTQEPH